MESKEANRLLATIYAVCAAVFIIGVLTEVRLVRAGEGWILMAGAVIFSVAAFKLRAEVADLAFNLKKTRAKLESQVTLTAETRVAIDSFSNGLDVAIFVCDDRGLIQYSNRFARALFGLSGTQQRSILSATLSVELEQLVLSCVDSPEPLNSEVTFTKEGADRIAIAKAWRGEQGDRRVYLSLVDVSELRRMERVRKDFVANVSHELRTPMTIIRAYAETMLDDDDKELRGRYLARIITEVDRLSSVTQDLLILSTAESSPIRKGPCDIADIARATVSQLESRAAEKGLTIQYDGPRNLMIEANGAQMTQVAINLIENAVKYSTAGVITVSIQDSPSNAIFRVADMGIGIASEHVERVFERFYRVDKGRSRASDGGTGLGLSIVKHIVDAHGGRIEIDSALNQGSTFSVTLPKGITELAPVAGAR